MKMMETTQTSRWFVVVLVVAVSTSCATMVQRGPSPDEATEVLAIELVDDGLTLEPPQVGRGKVTLDLTNRGRLEHAVRVVGPDVDEKVAEFLGPGEHRRQSLRLGPGTYRVFCPDGDHAEHGLSAQLVVTETATSFHR
ncbi:MAG: hypothetical protein JWM82_790 [Myxococcales bacterium]|jgi:hypothetical protein|nr:hypothetical protein [Myxococcales bacterium]